METVFFRKCAENMDPLQFEKVGTLIYGMQRLDSSLTSISHWLAPTVLVPDGASPDEKLSLRLTAATSFFAARLAHDDIGDEYAHVLIEVSLLEHLCANLLSSNGTAGLNQYLSRMRQAHSSLADVIEKIGYPDIPQNFLREHGIPS